MGKNIVVEAKIEGLGRMAFRLSVQVTDLEAIEALVQRHHLVALRGRSKRAFHALYIECQRWFRLTRRGKWLVPVSAYHLWRSIDPEAFGDSKAADALAGSGGSVG